MNRLTVFAISVCTSVCSYAQWTLPTPPAISDMTIESECYLFNKEANGFLMGGNEWGTRASVSENHGSKFYVDLYIYDSKWDSKSYYLINEVESGSLSGKKGYMFIEAIDKIYVDGTEEGSKNMGFVFDSYEDGSFRIGLSNLNETYNGDKLPDTYLGVVPEFEDNRVYCCNADSLKGDYDPKNFQTTWYIVSPKEYRAYTEKVNQYYEANELGKTLEEAKGLEGINEELMFDATFAYEHTFTSYEDLKTYNDSLKKIIKEIKLTIASIDKPTEILSLFGGIEQTFSNKQTTGWTMDTYAENKHAGNGNCAKDFSKTGIHLENWHKDALGNGSVWAKVTGIPNGIYKFSTLAFTNDTLTTLAFAGNDTAYVKTEMIDIERPTEVMTFVENNELTFGLQFVNSKANWIGLDNVNLYYLGTSFEAYKMMADKYVAKNKDYNSLIDNYNITYYSKEHYREYKTALKNIDEATTAEEVVNNLNSYKSAIECMERSITAYEEYVKLYTNAGMWLTIQTYDNESVELLDRYINGTDEPLGFNGNGNATFILQSLDLTLEEITSEKEYLEKLYDDAYASILKEGDDCTKLVKNPKFNEENGWSSAVGPVWPKGTDACHVFEAWNMICDVYQELTNLQNGLYEMSLQAVFRPGDEYTEENIKNSNAVIYINSFEEKIDCGEISTSEEASKAFAEGKYNVKVYGIVTDGKLRIGIKNKNKLADGCAIWAGNVSLRYYDKTSHAITEAIDHTLKYAKEVYSNSVCGVAEKDALNYAITFAHQEEDPFDELINLKHCIDEVINGNNLYVKLGKAVNLLDSEINKSVADDDIKKTLREINFKVSSLLSKQELSNAKAVEYLNKIYESIVLAKRYGYAEGTEDNPEDYSDLILNNNFAPEEGSLEEGNINGWNTTSMNGYKLNTVSYNRSEYELNQTIYGLKKGKYKVTVNGYYRAGYANEDEKHFNDSTDTHLAFMYVETPTLSYKKPLLNLTEGASEIQESENDCYMLTSGKFVPNSSASSAIYFSKGYYLNEIEFELKELGAVKIGITKKGIIANDYSVIGQWKLWNLGLVHEDVGISDTETTSDNTITGVYSVDGMRLSKPKNGINIIKEDNGTVKKIFIR
ncbi:MAG: hypothetical protein J5663_07455 [Bacteroidaceae bacterium]|nr:hypothetical protein [Bacteroidaceae bacterium]